MKILLEIAIQCDTRESMQQALSNLKRKLAEAPSDGERQTIPLFDKEKNWIGLAKFEEKK